MELQSKCVICAHNWNMPPKGSKMIGVLPVSKSGYTNDLQLMMCPNCFKDWTWSPNERFFRKRTPDKKWAHQYQLFVNVLALAGEFSISPSRIYTEVGFPDWAVSEKGWPLKFDIAIPSRKTVIEYNGEQHYRLTKPWHTNYEDFLKQKRNDEIKLDSIKARNWNALIFTYTEDVMSERWVKIRMEQVFGKKKR